MEALGTQIFADVLLSFPVFLGLAWLYRKYLLAPASTQHLLLLITLIIPLTLSLNFFYTSIIGLTGFWTTEITGLFYLIGSISSFVGGGTIPISAYPQAWQLILKALPFRYLYAFPLNVYLGKTNPQQIGTGLIIQALWVISFYIILTITWQLGVKRHEAFGG